MPGRYSAESEPTRRPSAERSERPNRNAAQPNTRHLPKKDRLGERDRLGVYDKSERTNLGVNREPEINLLDVDKIIDAMLANADNVNDDEENVDDEF